MPQEAVLKLLDMLDEKDRKKAMKTASGICGTDCISVNMKDSLLTVTGDFDPIPLLDKLRKLFSMQIEWIDKKGGGKNSGGGGGTSGDTITIAKLDLHDEKDKQKAMKIVSCISGVYLISLTMNDAKLTVKGDFNPIHVVEKLKNLFSMKLEFVNAMDEKKNDENKKRDEQNSKGGSQDQKGRGREMAGDKGVPFSYPITHYPPYMHRNYLPTYYHVGQPADF